MITAERGKPLSRPLADALRRQHGHRLPRAPVVNARRGSRWVWLDSDSDGMYDILDTLSDTFTGFAADPVCPVLHLAEIPIQNNPALPEDFGATGSPSGCPDWSGTRSEYGWRRVCAHAGFCSG